MGVSWGRGETKQGARGERHEGDSREVCKAWQYEPSRGAGAGPLLDPHPPLVLQDSALHARMGRPLSSWDLERHGGLCRVCHPGNPHVHSSLCASSGLQLLAICIIVCSYAFALPVATAPNAIVFGHSSMKTTDMMKAGFLMNIVCLITVALSINTYAVPLFDLNSFPDWASSKLENASLCTTSHSPTLQSTTPTFSSPPVTERVLLPA